MDDEVIFKSRKRPQSTNTRKTHSQLVSLKKCSAENSHDYDESQEDLELISSVKDYQNLRKKPSGVGTETLLSGKRVKSEVEITDNSKSKGGIRHTIQGDEEDQVRLSRTFASETNKRDEDAQMLKYIEEELSKRKGVVDNSKSQKNKNAVDILNQIPEDLRPVIGIQSEELLSNQMLVGIPEVDLGVEAKMKNIEATENAKQKLIYDRMSIRKVIVDETDLVPCNMSVNFVQHSRWKDTTGILELANEDDDQDARQTMLKIFHSRSVPLPRGAVIKNTNPELEAERLRIQAEKATDNIAVQKFRNYNKDKKKF